MDSPEFLHQLVVSVVLHHSGRKRAVGLDAVRLDDVDVPGVVFGVTLCVAGGLGGGLTLSALDLILKGLN